MAAVGGAGASGDFASVTGQCFIAGAWAAGANLATKRIIFSPCDVEKIVAEVPEASLEQVDAACEAAAKAGRAWRAVPAMERCRVMFKYRELLEAHLDELAASVVRENGKLLSEAKGEVRRGIDMVEFATGIPTQLMGKVATDVSKNVDSYVVREALGVVACIPPMNFPAMIPLWFMPIAIACGNSFVLKPAERAPLTACLLVDLLHKAGCPPGVVSLVHGGKEVSEHLIANAHVSAVSFVGSSPVASSVFRAAAAAGKRVQALGGAKNSLIVMPDADLGKAIPALIGSCFGCAGQRCLAGSVVIPVGPKERQDAVVDAFVAAAAALKMGDGMDPTSTLCPVINKEAQERVLKWIDTGAAEGCKVLLDGRTARPEAFPRGAFVGPAVFDDVVPGKHAIAAAEVFGPVVSITRAADLDAAITAANSTMYGNSASIFTSDGAAVRTFRARIQAGMLGVNLGVPAPFAMFSFGGWKGSMFGDLNAHGTDGVDFYTRKKVVTERWFGAEAPKDGWV